MKYFLNLTAFIINTCMLLLMIFSGILYVQYGDFSGALGLIDGKDGPTAVFVSGSFPCRIHFLWWIMFSAFIYFEIVFILNLRKIRLSRK